MLFSLNDKIFRKKNECLRVTKIESYARNYRFVMFGLHLFFLPTALRLALSCQVFFQ